MANLSSLLALASETLRVGEYHERAINGLQVDAGNPLVTRVATAVDVSLPIVERCLEERAELLVVHHGLYWGDPLPLTGALGRKVRALMRGGCSLAAYHLPLDGHEQLGNGVGLARFLGAEPTAPFSDTSTGPVGCYASFSSPRSMDELVKRAHDLTGVRAVIDLPFGRKEIQTMLVVTGAAAKLLPVAIAHGVDLFVSGEPRHQCALEAREGEMNALFVGHYASETFGVRALGEFFAGRCGVSTVFFDESSGI